MKNKKTDNNETTEEKLLVQKTEESAKEIETLTKTAKKNKENVPSNDQTDKLKVVQEKKKRKITKGPVAAANKSIDKKQVKKTRNSVSPKGELRVRKIYSFFERKNRSLDSSKDLSKEEISNVEDNATSPEIPGKKHHNFYYLKNKTKNKF